MNSKLPKFPEPPCKKRRECDGHCLAIGCCEIGDMACSCSWECAAQHQSGCKAPQKVLKQAMEYARKGLLEI